MANLRKWLTSPEVIKELKISKLDLLELVEDGKLLAHNPDDRDYYIMGVPVKLSSDGCNFVDRSSKVFTKDGQFIDRPKTLDELEKCYYLVKDVEALMTNISTIKSKNQEKWDEVRKVAKEEWDKDQSITIEDMALKDEINSITDNNEKTIRNHIKDLCPNRKPGRRPAPK